MLWSKLMNFLMPHNYGSTWPLLRCLAMTFGAVYFDLNLVEMPDQEVLICITTTQTYDRVVRETFTAVNPRYLQTRRLSLHHIRKALQRLNCACPMTLSRCLVHLHEVCTLPYRLKAVTHPHITGHRLVRLHYHQIRFAHRSGGQTPHAVGLAK
jgi:hypothetical protein